MVSGLKVFTGLERISLHGSLCCEVGTAHHLRPLGPRPRERENSSGADIEQSVSSVSPGALTDSFSASCVEEASVPSTVPQLSACQMLFLTCISCSLFKIFWKAFLFQFFGAKFSCFKLVYFRLHLGGFPTQSTRRMSSSAYIFLALFSDSFLMPLGLHLAFFAFWRQPT